MATTTTNNGWTIPQSSDLVTNGATAIATLGNGIDTSVGTGLKAWTSWTPTLSGGWANGNGTWSAYYCQLGKTLHVSARFVLGSTTTKGSTMVMNLPGALTFKDYLRFAAYGQMIVAGGSSTPFIVNARGLSTTTFEVFDVAANGTYAAGNAITSTTPAIWATNDSLVINFTTEVA